MYRHSLSNWPVPFPPTFEAFCSPAAPAVRRVSYIMATRWGIASCGKISADFTLALSLHPKGQHQVVAAAARSLASAKEFAASHGIPRAYGEYRELALDPEVEVVYVGAINPAHLPLARMFLEAGKAVLCEKPLAMNLRETKELVALARNKGVFLMEAVWSRCLPAYVVPCLSCFSCFERSSQDHLSCRSLSFLALSV